MLRQSVEIDKLATALLAAQVEMPNATLNKTNPHFRSRYADAVGVRDTILPILNKHGLVVTQGGDVWDGVPVVVTMLIHAASGQFRSFGFPIPDGLSAQQQGSAIAYDRRYGAAAIAFIFAEEDDDGNAAEPEPATTKTTKRVAAPKPANDNVPQPEAPSINAPVNPATGKVEPHEIKFVRTEKGVGSDYVSWASRLVAGMKSAATDTEISEWEGLNRTTMVDISKAAPKIYARLTDHRKEQYERVRQTVTGKPEETHAGPASS